MIAWYDRIGNRIEMQVYEEKTKSYEWVKGKVVEGYRYRDGSITMKPDNGNPLVSCGCSSGAFRKADDSLGDLISNADKIRSMTDSELAIFLLNMSDYNIPLNLSNIKSEDRTDEYCISKIKQWLESENEREVDSR